MAPFHCYRRLYCKVQPYFYFEFFGITSISVQINACNWSKINYLCKFSWVIKFNHLPSLFFTQIFINNLIQFHFIISHHILVIRSAVFYLIKNLLVFLIVFQPFFKLNLYTLWICLYLARLEGGCFCLENYRGEF